MQLNFTGTNIELTEALKNFTNEKFQPIAKRFEHLTNVNVIFKIDHVTHIAEATLHDRGIEIFASAEADDMYAAIEAMTKKLLTQLEKHKEKIIDSHRQPSTLPLDNTDD